MSTQAMIVYCTLPDTDDAARIARAVVEEKLAACVNLVPGVRSIYRWQGEVFDDGERLAIIKTTVDGFEALRARLVELHPYDTPEVIGVPIAAGHPPYLAWLTEACERSG